MRSHRIFIGQLSKPRRHVASIPGNHAPEQLLRKGLGICQIERFAVDPSISAQQEGLAFGPTHDSASDASVLIDKTMKPCLS
jgi:hypothetical protein